MTRAAFESDLLGGSVAGKESEFASWLGSLYFPAPQ